MDKGIEKIETDSSLENTFLNLMRFGAAFSILVYHFYLLVPNHTGNTIGTDSFPFKEWLGFPYSHGFLSVQAFWIISGYVLSKAYLNRKWEIFDFLRNRFARLYPLHIFTLLIIALENVSIDWVDPSSQDDQVGILSVQLKTANGVISVD